MTLIGPIEKNKNTDDGPFKNWLTLNETQLIITNPKPEDRGTYEITITATTNNYIK